jgi:hypothetical protein
MTYFLFTGLDIQMTHIVIEFWMNLELKVSQKRIFKKIILEFVTTVKQ